MKRKRADQTEAPVKARKTGTTSIQIITGSYERVLHGFAATLPAAAPSDKQATTFTDTFLFSAHSSSIRSLAVSPATQAGKRTLATGSADERVNLYQLSSSPPDLNVPIPTLGSSISENPQNKELGSLLHHTRTVNRLSFANKTKLFSAADDNTICITRTRDWTLLSSIKAPVPKQLGRPSGDTAAPGEVPAGVNDFAIHPSMKLMLTVGKGERCMRLWNLVTGKKAGVLNFDKPLLAQVGEGRFGSGEGRRIVWNGSGEKFVVVFERGALVYGMDSEPIAVVKPTPLTKIHQVRFLPELNEIMVLSTEGGRMLFFDLSKTKSKDDKVLPECEQITQIESPTLGSTGRIKDFQIFSLGTSTEHDLMIVTASSDGTVRLWGLSTASFVLDKLPSPIASLLGVRETSNRLTCITGFIMDGSKSETNGDHVDES